MKFCPTPQKANSDELKEDRFQFLRRIRLAEYFHGSEERQNKSAFVKNKCNFTPDKSNNQPQGTNLPRASPGKVLSFWRFTSKRF